MTHSWTEVQALAIRAARGADVPPAQALAFGAMLARHLADNGSEAPLADALHNPGTIVDLALRIEEMIESASVTGAPVSVREDAAGPRALLISWLAGLPCQTELQVMGHTITATLSLSQPSTRARPERVTLSPALYAQMQDLAAQTYVPDSEASRTGGAGAGQMELD